MPSHMIKVSAKQAEVNAEASGDIGEMSRKVKQVCTGPKPRKRT